MNFKPLIYAILIILIILVLASLLHLPKEFNLLLIITTSILIPLCLLTTLYNYKTSKKEITITGSSNFTKNFNGSLNQIFNNFLNNPKFKNLILNYDIPYSLKSNENDDENKKKIFTVHIDNLKEYFQTEFKQTFSYNPRKQKPKSNPFNPNNVIQGNNLFLNSTQNPSLHYNLFGETHYLFTNHNNVLFSHHMKFIPENITSPNSRIIQNPLIQKIYIPEFRILNPNSNPLLNPLLSYRQRTNELKKACHWGQLKLFLTEIELLTMVQSDPETKDLPKVLIYAGSAPGDHSVLLHKMFPEIMFVYIDPQEFDTAPFNYSKGNTTNFKLFSSTSNPTSQRWQNDDPDKILYGYMTDHIANYLKDVLNNELSGYYSIFVSDIRLNAPKEETIVIDHKLQFGWNEILNSDISMHKFRLPYENLDKTEDKILECPFPVGEIRIQPFPGVTSTETRLIVKKENNSKFINNKSYFKIYEDLCFTHNYFRSVYKFNLPGEENKTFTFDDHGFCNCYDCITFRFLISNLLNHFAQESKHGFNPNTPITSEDITNFMHLVIYGSTPTKNYNIVTESINTWWSNLGRVNNTLFPERVRGTALNEETEEITGARKPKEDRNNINNGLDEYAKADIFEKQKEETKNILKKPFLDNIFKWNMRDIPTSD